MKGIAEWLSSMEQTAEDLYREAAIKFEGDKDFHKFLLMMADEEAVHFNLLQKAVNYFSTAKNVTSPIIIDDITKEKINKQFANAATSLESHDICRDSCIAEIIDLELSELNNIFQYIFNYLASKHPDFADVGAKMNNHTAHIQSLVESDPSLAKYIDKFNVFPEIGKIKILIVDDESFIVKFLKDLLKDQGEIDTAPNGESALVKLKSNHYNLIISDINMPHKGGIELYNDAVKINPKIGSHFLFFSGFIADDNEAFIRKNKLHYLNKPAAIKDIQQKCQTILHGFTGNN